MRCVCFHRCNTVGSHGRIVFAAQETHLPLTDLTPPVLTAPHSSTAMPQQQHKAFLAALESRFGDVIHCLQNVNSADASAFREVGASTCHMYCTDQLVLIIHTFSAAALSAYPLLPCPFLVLYAHVVVERAHQDSSHTACMGCVLLCAHRPSV